MTATCPCCGAQVDPLDILTDPDRRVVARGDIAAEFTVAEFAVLACLIEHAPHVVPDERMHDRLYAERRDGGPASNSLRVLAYKIRAKLRPLGLAVTRLGQVGYRLTVDGEAVAIETPARRHRLDEDQARALGRAIDAGFSARMLATAFRLPPDVAEDIIAVHRADRESARQASRRVA